MLISAATCTIVRAVGDERESEREREREIERVQSVRIGVAREHLSTCSQRMWEE